VKNNVGLYNEFISKLCDENKEPDYDIVDALVVRYQNGDKNAAEELIGQMAPYMIKFFKIMKLGIIDLSDKDSRRFISLFIDNYETRSKLKKAFQSTDIRSEAYQSALWVQSMCSGMPTEDIIQELIVIMLTLARRYTKRKAKVNFCGYIYNSFRFELGRRIKSITIDPLTHRTDFNVSFNDGEHANEEELIEENAQVYINEPLVVLEEELGNSWIRGLTCGPQFSLLTQLQRIIIKMHYVDGEGDTAIAERIGVHRNTVRSQRMRAEEILRQAKDDPNAQEKQDKY
jgi:RNA polymerase sigma factor (sigma-70 family)